MHPIAEFVTCSSREAKLVYECARVWWCLGVPVPPLPGVLATTALRLARGPVDGQQVCAEGERYTELLTELIANREAAREAKPPRVILRRAR